MISKIGQGHQWFIMHTKQISQFWTRKLFKQNENLKIATKTVISTNRNFGRDI